MPSVPGPPEAAALHAAFAAHGPLDWREGAWSADGIARLYGADAARRSLEILQRAVGVEPRLTAEFVAALPDTATPYQLDRRVKSPESLARKIQSAAEKRKRMPPTDVLRYTALTASPHDLVAATRHVIDGLTDNGWKVTFAMHSYVDGSRYKGIHAYLTVPDFDRVEVQFHSAASVKVKELTTQWYEIERNKQTSDHDRAVARRHCIDLSETLPAPAGIDGLATLGGRPVVVNNYSDHWMSAQPRRQRAGGGRRVAEQQGRYDGRMR